MCGTCGCDDTRDDPRRIEVERSLLADNDQRSDALRKQLGAHGIRAIGLIGSPGAGKTALLETTFRRLDSRAGDAVIEGDCATDRDARRIAACGVQATQIETGGQCHLDAAQVETAASRLDLRGLKRVWIENVGNLVCPAPFACGEHRRVLLISTPEGDDKPEKYPAACAAADLLVITKTDLLPHLDFDVARCADAARRARPGLPVLALSTRSGDGIAAWLRWVETGAL